MAETLKALVERFAQSGQVIWIGLRPERRAAMLPVEEAVAGTRGFAGDHGASDKRAVTLIQAEHLPVIGSFLGRGPVAASDVRRNLVVAGINLSALKGRHVRVGAVVLEITGICAPCSRMERALGAGGYAAMRGHGGWCARVVEPGLMRVGDDVTPLTTPQPRSL